MSHQNNITLEERAYRAMDELTSHPAGRDKLIQAALDSGDLDDLYYQVVTAEAELSQQHFYDYNILEAGDEY